MYAFALCLQLLIHIPYFVKAAAFKQTGAEVVRKLLDILTYAAPVGTPTIFMMIGRIGEVRLARGNMRLKFPDAMQLGGMADVVCFDKTGTLTHSVVGLGQACNLPALCMQSMHERDSFPTWAAGVADSSSCSNVPVMLVPHLFLESYRASALCYLAAVLHMSHQCATVLSSAVTLCCISESETSSILVQ